MTATTTTTEPAPQPAASPVETPLPCPFCGTAPGVHEDVEDSGAYVACENDDCEICVVGLHQVTRAAAIHVWNTRA